LRLPASEALLLGAEANIDTITEAARRATTNASPLPMTGYKLDLLSGLVHDLLERIAG
jgi:xanthine dehydrogenase YagS FAD-binding subunit